ncbi:hypothetical protein [Streptomyces aidingensis]|uniref:Uncharacterized protein n=1 Tax=Streptomyces aidingensis TaxID=910347 RepID=A0A1I1H1B9_9ACTN|nr:hypothetical protein [Streptomyces aidingensis]SFC15203.1 hypothetical protein SAMN05421773_102137 [Streptomyces aidingensis]
MGTTQDLSARPSGRPVLTAVAGTFALAVAGIAAVAVVSVWPGGGPGDADGSQITAAGDERVPSWTGTDWVTYADHVAVVNVAGETDLAPSAEEREIGEGLIGRTVRVEITEPLWSREHAPALPDEVEFTAVGWFFEGERRRAFAVESSPRLELGHSYIIALARFSDGWGPLGTGGVLPYDEGVIGNGESEGRVLTPAEALEQGQAIGLEEDLLGHDAGELAGYLAEAVPDPRAEPYGHLPADVRFERTTGTIG